MFEWFEQLPDVDTNAVGSNFALCLSLCPVCLSSPFYSSFPPLPHFRTCLPSFIVSRFAVILLRRAVPFSSFFLGTPPSPPPPLPRVAKLSVKLLLHDTQTFPIIIETHTRRTYNILDVQNLVPSQQTLLRERKSGMSP